MAEILADSDPKGGYRWISGGWLGKSLIWVGYLVLAGICSGLWPNSIGVGLLYGGVWISGLGVLAASKPYPWYRKFVNCGALVYVSLSLANLVLVLILLAQRDSDFALDRGGAAVTGLVAAFGLWLLRKSADAERQGKGRFLPLFLVWALVAWLPAGLSGFGDWIVAGALTAMTVRFGLRSSQLRRNQL